jgi:hypothetical protein
MEEKKENIINVDFQGCPEFKMSIKDIIEKLGAVYNKETNKWEIPNEEWLECFPMTIEDDGMGYGVNEQYIVDVDIDKVGNTCNIWRDIALENAEIYVELGLYPGRFFIIDGVEYNLCEIKKHDDKYVVGCIIWNYNETEDENGNINIENPCGGWKEFDLDYVLEHMEKFDNSPQDEEELEIFYDPS